MEDPGIFLKGPYIDSLTYKHSDGLQWRGSNVKEARDIQGKGELCSFRLRDRGTAVISSVELISHVAYSRAHLSCVKSSPKGTNLRQNLW